MDSSDLEAVAAAVAVIAIIVKKRKSKKITRKRRSVWVKPWLLRRRELGAFSNLLSEFRQEDIFEYGKFLRITPDVFDELVNLIEGSIKKQNTVMRDALTPSIKLAATIRYLATGSSYSDLQHLFRIHRTTLSLIIPEVCEAIYENLKDQYLQVSIFLN